MRTVRIYEPQSTLNVGTTIMLSEDGANHVARVLRMQENDKLVLFNGNGYQYQATITSVTKKTVTVVIDSSEQHLVESPIRIHLGQVLSRGDKMDFTLQKAVELGVNEITPLVSVRCGVRLKDDRLDKKQDSLQKIVISACEQCGRTIVPKVNPIMTLSDFLQQETADFKLTLNPYTDKHIKDLAPQSAYRLLIGPEGGFSEEEVQQANAYGYTDVLLGPRILRTETAALVAVSILQAEFGDL